MCLYVHSVLRWKTIKRWCLTSVLFTLLKIYTCISTPSNSFRSHKIMLWHKNHMLNCEICLFKVLFIQFFYLTSFYKSLLEAIYRKKKKKVIHKTSHLFDIHLSSSNLNHFTSERKHSWWIHYAHISLYIQTLQYIHHNNKLQDEDQRFLMETVLTGIHRPYGFLFPTMSALDVTLLFVTWSVGLSDGLATTFWGQRKLKLLENPQTKRYSSMPFSAPCLFKSRGLEILYKTWYKKVIKWAFTDGRFKKYPQLFLPDKMF